MDLILLFPQSCHYQEIQQVFELVMLLLFNKLYESNVRKKLECELTYHCKDC